MEFKNFADLEVGDVVISYHFHNGEIEKKCEKMDSHILIKYRHLDIRNDYSFCDTCINVWDYYNHEFIDNKLVRTTEVGGLNRSIWYDEKYNILYTTIPDIDAIVKGIYECGKEGMRFDIKKLLNIDKDERNYKDILYCR